MKETYSQQSHSSAWIFQAWASFILAISATTAGIIYLPTDNWTKGFMGMGLLFSVGSAFNVAKTTRDLHESKKFSTRIDEARVEKLIADHHPLK